jgi:peptidoglycan/xylan/chitin deacetylase (PgdA/CDA1 family)
LPPFLPLLRVLTYHRIADPEAESEFNPRSISATPQMFQHHMEHLARSYSVLSPAEAIDLLDRGKRPRRRSVLVTFDDAYVDFAQNAWPVMKSLDLPATLFVPTFYPGERGRVFWWDRLHQMIQATDNTMLDETPVGALPLGSPEERRLAVRRLQDHLKVQPAAALDLALDKLATACASPPPTNNGVLSWAELRALAEDGVTLGAHTQSHSTLQHLTVPEIRKEILGSIADLEREIGRIEPLFCFPGGSHDDRVVEVTREAGVRLAFTTLDGPNPLTGDNLLRLRRTNITPRTGKLIFRLRLLPLATHVDHWRHREKHQGQVPSS